MARLLLFAAMVAGAIYLVWPRELKLVIYRDRISQDTLAILAAALKLMTLLFGPAYAALSITREREMGTLDLVCSTPISAKDLFECKFLANAAFVWILITATLPMAATVFLLGGVPGWKFAVIYLELYLWASAVSAYSVLCSAQAQHSPAAMALSYSRILPAGALWMVFPDYHPIWLGAAILALVVIIRHEPALRRLLYPGDLLHDDEGLGGPAGWAFERRGILTQLLVPRRPAVPMRSWQNPILFRELRCEALGGGWVWLRRILPTAITAGAGCAALFALWLNHVGLWFLGVAAIAGFAVPALAAPSITREFEHGTFDSLAVSPMRPFFIIWPKIYLPVRTGMVLAIVMLALGAPLAYFGSPATLNAIPMGLGVIAASMVVLSAIGVFCSMASRSTAQAMVVSYAVPLFLFAGGPTLCHLLRIYSDHPVSSYSWLAAVSPAAPLLAWGEWPWLVEKSPWLREIAQFYGPAELAINFCAISLIATLALFLVMVFGFDYFWKKGPLRRS